MYQDILDILKKNKYENDFAGVYPYEKEEYAKMITDYMNKKKHTKKELKVLKDKLMRLIKWLKKIVRG